ncbi:hypothetical protein H0H81_000274 [Sphagnurus paluster]|uniref:Cyclin-domain-containing protein n=1 Tax=Sphagnurus paluster TaxID=117069 RepID=A0A9P7KH40_9AGAR|nr:hypothetical protein H0H81_000274 [Sphagnurus paluster]
MEIGHRTQRRLDMLAVAQPLPDLVGPHRIPNPPSSSSSSSYRKPAPTPATTTSSSSAHSARPTVQLHIQSPPPPAPHLSPASSSAPPPLNIHSYPAPDLLRLLASLLTQIAATNDSLSPLPSPTSPQSAPHPHTHSALWPTLTSASRIALTTPAATLTFHARNVPTISLEAYLLRILKYCPTTNEVFLALLVYFDRMSKLSQDAVARSFVIDSFNIHRLVIAGVTVASKFFSDVFYTNSRYAKVGGLPLAELNQLELQFLLLNDFRLVISTAEMQRYAEQLILFSSSPEATAPPPPPKPPAFQQMGAIDAYGGAVPSHPEPTHPPPAPSPAPSISDADTETETEAETETTDDEPTIRPARGSVSVFSDAGSVYSFQSSVADESEAGECVAEDEGETARTPARPRGRERSKSSASGVWDTGDEGGDESEDADADTDEAWEEGSADEDSNGRTKTLVGIGRVRRGSGGSAKGRVRKRVRGVPLDADTLMRSP